MLRFLSCSLFLASLSVADLLLLLVYVPLELWRQVNLLLELCRQVNLPLELWIQVNLPLELWRQVHIK
jgi:hypothetical protein